MPALMHVADDHEIHAMSLSINTLHYQQMSLQPLLLHTLHPLPLQTLSERPQLNSNTTTASSISEAVSRRNVPEMWLS